MSLNNGTRVEWNNIYLRGGVGVIFMHVEVVMALVMVLESSTSEKRKKFEENKEMTTRL